MPAELQGLPQPRGGSGLECYDAAMVTAEVQPVVFEEVRLEVDQEMRLLIQSIKVGWQAVSMRPFCTCCW